MLGGENIHTGTQGARLIPSSALQACVPQGLAVGWEHREGTATSSATPCGWTDELPRQFWRTTPTPAGAHRLQGSEPEPDRAGAAGAEAA